MSLFRTILQRCGRLCALAMLLFAASLLCLPQVAFGTSPAQLPPCSQGGQGGSLSPPLNSEGAGGVRLPEIPGKEHPAHGTSPERILVPPTVILGDEDSTETLQPLVAPPYTVRAGRDLRREAYSLLLAAGIVDPTAAPQGEHVCPPPDVWLIDARGQCGCPLPGETPSLRYFQYAAGDWQPSSLESFVDVQPDVPVVFWVHGNRIDSAYANDDGWTMYKRLAETACGRRFRFVIWSWPASQIHGQLQDLRVKATQADNGGYALAWVVSRLAPEQSVGLIGYSYGARLIAGGLHVLGGGEISGAALPAEALTRTGGTRAVFWAAAIDEGAMAPWGYRNLALDAVDTMLITVNCADPALKWYRRLWGHRGPEALGFSGPVGLADWSKVLTMDVSGIVGRSHEWQEYANSQSVMSATAEMVLGNSAASGEIAPHQARRAAVKQ